MKLCFDEIGSSAIRSSTYCLRAAEENEWMIRERERNESSKMGGNKNIDFKGKYRLLRDGTRCPGTLLNKKKYTPKLPSGSCFCYPIETMSVAQKIRKIGFLRYKRILFFSIF